jgi:hypothetical protein
LGAMLGTGAGRLCRMRRGCNRRVIVVADECGASGMLSGRGGGAWYNGTLYVLEQTGVGIPYVDGFLVNSRSKGGWHRSDWRWVDWNGGGRDFAKEYVTECGNGLEFIWWSLLDARDSCHQITGCGDDSVGGGNGGDGHGVMLETERVGESFAAVAFHDGLDTVVVLEEWPDVPAVGGMIGPGLATGGFEMDKYFRARRGHGCGVKREGTLHGFKRQEEWILVAGLKHVDHVVALVC